MTKKSKYRPKLFIGSSSEGLKIARVIKELLSADTVPTLWEDDIFKPGTITLEVLEEQLDNHKFALLVATPDDWLLKRDLAANTLRDNVLFECGLFMGALGRRRTFLFAPKDTHIELPTDLRGLSIAKYVWSDDTPREALQPAIDGIISAIHAELRRLQHASREYSKKQNLSEQHHALLMLHQASGRLMDVLVEVPRHISGLHDRAAFGWAKQDAQHQLVEISNLWVEFARTLDNEKQFKALVSRFEAAIQALPFYRDVEVVGEPRVLVSDLPWLKRLFQRPTLSPEASDFVKRLGLRDPREVQSLRGALSPDEQAVEQQVEHLVRLVTAGLGNWWSVHGQELIRELRAFELSLFETQQVVTYALLKG